MKNNLKYLVLSVFIPLAVMAGKPTDDTLYEANTNSRSASLTFPISNQDNRPFSESTETPQYARHPLYFWNEHKQNASKQDPIIILVKTEKFSVFSLQSQPELYHFKEARHLWCLHGESGRNLARPSLYSIFERDDSKKTTIAKHLLRLGSKTDKEFAMDYFLTVLFNKDHNDHSELTNLLNEDVLFKNQFYNIIYKYFT